MQVILYAHIPGLRINAPQPLAGGRLERLAFDEWVALESEYQNTESAYTKADPVFWVRELALDVEWTEETLAHAVSDAVWPVHVAFLLDATVPLIPTPTLSCSYVALPVSPEFADVVSRPTRRFIGPLEREFIVYGSPLTYRFDAEELTAVDERHRLLVANGVLQWDGEILAGITVLEETARPDSWYVEDLKTDHLHGFVRCMAAVESILLPPEDEGNEDDTTTQTFGRHAAALLAPLLTDRDEAAKYFADLYRFRSKLMHGRTVPDPQEEAVLAQLHHGRRLLRDVVCAALAVHGAAPDAAPLGTMLQEAWADADRQRALAGIVARGVRA